MKEIYLDNASTSYPKHRAVAEAVYEFMVAGGSNINRGSYSKANAAGERVFLCRQQLCAFFNGPDPRYVVFTKNITEGLNMALKGLLKAGDHVLTTSMEHNAVMRPLRQLEQQGVEVTVVAANSEGLLDPAALPQYIKKNTVALVMSHGSNVCGTVQPLEAVGAFCRGHNLAFIVDSAQTAGLLPIDMEQQKIDILCFTGHKGLLGPQGIGGFIIRPELVLRLEPLLSGGTGSLSHLEKMPKFMPDRFEAGTLNLPGIMGLSAALGWLHNQGREKLLDHELELTETFIQGLEKLDPAGRELAIKGLKTKEGRLGVVAVALKNIDMAAFAYELEARYGIMTRVGLHCAPAAHKTLGTYPKGVMRFSFGWANTRAQVEQALAVIKELLEEKWN